MPFRATANFLAHVTISTNKQGEANFQMKEHLKGAGWIVKASGDGLTAFSSTGDVITSGGSGAGGMLNTRAWWRVQSPDLQREFTFQLISTASNDTQFRIKYSVSAGFTGGTPDADETPSATDEKLLLGGGTDAAPTGFAFYGDMASGSDFLFGAADTAAPFGFYFAMYSDALGNNLQHGIVFDPLRSGFPVESVDDDPYVIYVFAGVAQDAFRATTSLSAATPQAFCYFKLNDAGEGFERVKAQSLIDIPNDVNPNPENAKKDGIPVLWAREDGQPDPDGIKGYSSLMRWFAQVDGIPRLFAYNVTGIGSNAFIRARNVILPWDGTLPAGHTNDDLNLWSAPDELDVGGDTTEPTVSNVSPASGSEISKNQAITFDVADNIAVTLAAGWLRYEGSNESLLIYDGDGFRFPFNILSTVDDVNGDQTLLQFSILPVGGWVTDIAELTFRASDGNLDII